MTSTVVIGNSYGVACATDTVGTLEGVPRKNGRRTNDGEIKLQGLKKPHAVAILGTGSVHINGVPFTTHIANWRESLSDNVLPNMVDYVDSFTSYLQISITANQSCEELLKDYLVSWDIRCMAVRTRLDGKGDFTEKGLAAFFEENLAIRETKGRRQPLPFADEVFKELGKGSPFNRFEKEVRPEHSRGNEHSSIEGVMESVFGSRLTKRNRKLAFEWAHCFLGEFHPTPYGGTLMFTGFGGRDHSPVAVKIHIEEVVLGRLFTWGPYVTTAARQLGGAGYSLFETMGSDDEIARLMNEVGLAPHFPQAVIRSALGEPQTPEGNIENENDRRTSNVRRFGTWRMTKKVPVENQLSSARDEIEADLAELKEKNLERVRLTIAESNLKKIGSMAARFVQLENFAMDLRGQLATVGHDVDLGVITKADGFSWVDSITGHARDCRQHVNARQLQFEPTNPLVAQ